MKTSTTINRPPETVAAFVTDTRNTTKWQQASGLLEMTCEPSGPFKLGSRLTEKRKMGGKTSTYVGEVIAFELNKTWTIRDSVNKPPKFQGVFTLAPVSGGTRYTFDFDFKLPLLMFPFTPLIKGSMAKAMRKDADALKSLVEAQGK
ncbi:MAG: hypothetical protein EXR49_06955 [Dehalococcoidia bacterium]|nr:hypothetical protein [Dehalococcoidia bacterium]